MPGVWYGQDKNVAPNGREGSGTQASHALAFLFSLELLSLAGVDWSGQDVKFMSYCLHVNGAIWGIEVLATPAGINMNH